MEKRDKIGLQSSKTIWGILPHLPSNRPVVNLQFCNEIVSYLYGISAGGRPVPRRKKISRPAFVGIDDDILPNCLEMDD